ncbi:TBC domain-containing protein C1952.17c isoform X3 [Triticum aestivum]|uniref:TBC domain-containing protein C1952.17c isoform X3 n=1 Tax=Triticum aestivum TaxID=4565 RepID=UPI001D0289EE|nr:TBC domain-containing protein C1952.17c-like isoform X3 [Triticum aestivum]
MADGANPNPTSTPRQKAVPDWLNSPIWSAPAPTPRHRSPPRAPSPPPPPPPKPQHDPTPPPPRQPARRDGASSDSDSDSGGGDEGAATSSRTHLVAEFKAALERKVVDLAELRRLACQGVPDDPAVRPVVWKLLLGYLPMDHALWAYELEKKRSQYSAFKDELLVNPSEVTRRMEMTISKRKEHNSEGTGFLPRAEIVQDEHPLSLGKTSVWNQHFQESETVEQIDRDVKRTHPEMQFFNGGSSDALSNQESLKRILTIFAKLNPGIRYVQGMNEVLAPLYYVFKNDPDQSNSVVKLCKQQTEISRLTIEWLRLPKERHTSLLEDQAFQQMVNDHEQSRYCQTAWGKQQTYYLQRATQMEISYLVS